MIFEISVNNYDLSKTLKSGQVFRYRELTLGQFEVHAVNRVCQIHQEGNTLIVEDECPDNEQAWRRYFHSDLNCEKLRDLMSSNPVLRCAYAYSMGTHFLNQDPFECLISFILSQQNNIPRIQACVEKLCAVCGERLTDGSFGFPSPERILSTKLSTRGFGYRASYISDAATRVAYGLLDLDSLRSSVSTYQHAMTTLQSVRGVGAKVASCVTLFSLGYTSAFPIDVHIQRILDLPEMREFKPGNYEDYAGYIQQYLFNWALYNGY